MCGGLLMFVKDVDKKYQNLIKNAGLYFGKNKQPFEDEFIILILI